MPLQRIQPDKWKHIIVGAILGAAGQLILQALLPGIVIWKLALLTTLGVAMIAYGFELFSKITGKGHYELWDAIASVVGGLIGTGIVLLAAYWS